MDPTFSGEVMHFFRTAGEQFQTNFTGLVELVRANFGNFLWHLLGTAVILLGAQAVMKWISAITGRAMEKNRKLLPEQQRGRVDTLMTLIRSAARYGVYFVAILLVLGQFGGGMAQSVLLAVGGVGSIAFGFGAQNLVKDVVTGLFMIFENQFAVGDYIQTEEAAGTVEATAIRVTYLRSLSGEQIIVPNGTIGRVVNYSRGGYMATIVVSTAYEADTAQVIQIMEGALERYGREHQELLLEMPVVRGVDALNTSSVDISAACAVKPMKRWEVERGMRLAVKEEFDKLGVEFPYPRVVPVPWKGRLSPRSAAAPPDASESPASPEASAECAPAEGEKA